MSQSEAIQPLLRSALFVPASRPSAIEKAAGLGADLLMLDLEDAVGEGDKSEAREAVGMAISLWRGAGVSAAIRINGTDTGFWRDDLAAASDADFIVIPKVDGVADLEAVRTAAPDGPKLIAMIETPHAVMSLPALMASAEGVGLAGLIAGTNDLAKALRLPADRTRTGLVPHLASMVLAGRAAGLFVLDGVFNAYRDDEGFELEAHQGKALGFDGKSLIHPAQVPLANRVFAPTPAEIERAHAIVSAFADAPGKGAIPFDGEMIEQLHRERAEALIRSVEERTTR
ncbi:MAG: CoA ester lyase [Maricaulis sp.]|jgi:citrate lyase beta subunit|nr:CoA ester lyase [Maricaulis sp.]HAQ34188.1 CoA ester lyase [Alphaproteobacteria bacterium]